MGSDSGVWSEDVCDAVVRRIAAWLPKFHCMIIGPGLGRDPLMMEVAKRVFVHARASNIPVVLDSTGS